MKTSTHPTERQSPMNRTTLHKTLVVAAAIGLGSISMSTDALARGGGRLGGGHGGGFGGGHFGGAGFGGHFGGGGFGGRIGGFGGGFGGARLGGFGGPRFAGGFGGPRFAGGFGRFGTRFAAVGGFNRGIGFN